MSPILNERGWLFALLFCFLLPDTANITTGSVASINAFALLRDAIREQHQADSLPLDKPLYWTENLLLSPNEQKRNDEVTFDHRSVGSGPNVIRQGEDFMSPSLSLRPVLVPARLIQTHKTKPKPTSRHL